MGGSERSTVVDVRPDVQFRSRSQRAAGKSQYPTTHDASHTIHEKGSKGEGRTLTDKKKGMESSRGGLTVKKKVGKVGARTKRARWKMLRDVDLSRGQGDPGVAVYRLAAATSGRSADRRRVVDLERRLARPTRHRCRGHPARTNLISPMSKPHELERWRETERTGP